VGVLAHIFGELRAARINVEQTENVVYAGAEAACARIQVDPAPGPDVLERIRTGLEDIFSVTLTKI
jgi:D-3-phosphoglycerate dehydrogenase